ncbi:MAG TPA: peptidylprolyl isomerase [Nostoc sp.]|uniref:peptidylprolyl isomerase n=1 Tax=Nostoc sp. TaxID=1180 RepID=UPI002D43D911|nr:peptidylprolyl isomerase [Nostoc sp.]HYX14559.1 peptidylprolyl isomerase [Nostoc sp.]
MSQAIRITHEDIIQEIKLSCKVPEIMKKIIIRKIILNYAATSGIELANEELQKRADKIRFLNKLITANDTWSWLEKHSLSLDDFEQIVYINLIEEKLFQYLIAEKVDPYFFEHQLDYTGVVMYEILLNDEDLAVELYYAIKEGEMSFYDAAHQYIEDTELRRKCGYQEKVNRKDLKPEISAAVFAAKPPQLLKPIVAAKGVHLILVEEIIQPQLDNELRQKIASDLFSEWLKQQSAEFEIVKHLDSK